jgi:hypothetical protein
MTSTNFEKHSEKHQTWLLKYQSKTIQKPVYFVWYYDTDENSTSRLLTYKTGKIFVTNSKECLKTDIIAQKSSLDIFENLNLWLADFDNIEIKEDFTYDIVLVQEGIEKGNLDISTLEGFANFASVFTDFEAQDTKNEHLKIFSKNKNIQKTWDYYYSHIFWPRFNDKKKFESWKRPALKISSKNLLIAFSKMVKSFEGHFKNND